MNPRKTYVLILTGAALWCGLILLAPYLASVASPLSEFVYRSFHPICHQLPERSFHIFDEKLAVCSRCSSIYVAFLVGILAYPFIRLPNNPFLQHSNAPVLHNLTKPSVLIVTLLPMVIDVGLDMVGLHESDAVTRTLTGTLFGFVVTFFVLPAALEGVQPGCRLPTGQAGTGGQLSSLKPSIVEHQKGISNA